MPSWMGERIIEIIINAWRGTLSQTDKEGMRNYPEVADAMFCEDNQYMAALAVFKVSTFTPPPDLSKRDAIDKAKWIASDGRLGRWD